MQVLCYIGRFLFATHRLHTTPPSAGNRAWTWWFYLYCCPTTCNFLQEAVDAHVAQETEPMQPNRCCRTTAEGQPHCIPSHKASADTPSLAVNDRAVAEPS